MKVKRSLARALLLSGLVMLVLAACVPPVAEQNGSLVVILVDGVNSRTFLPDISMEVDHYLVTGTRSGGGGDFSLTPEPGASSATVDGLRWGTWAITVEAYNVSNTKIGEGQGTVEVRVAAPSTLTVTVVPLQQEGTLNLTVKWNTGAVAAPPLVVATLTPLPTGASESLGSLLVYNNEAGTATCSKALADGYYSLAVKLMAGDVNIGGDAAVLRIVNELPTNVLFDLTDVTNGTGELTVSIDTNLANPLDVSIAGGATSLLQSDVMHVTASVAGVNDVSYFWYLNGDFLSSGSDRFIVGSVLMPGGVYSLSVLAVKNDRAGSAAIRFEVTASSFPKTLHANPANNEVHGHGWDLRRAITLRIVDGSGGDLITPITQQPGAMDFSAGQPTFWLAGLRTLQVGDKAMMTDGITTKSVLVSRLKITSVRADNNTIAGEADPGSSVMVNIWSQNGVARRVTVGGDGTWTADFGVFGDEEFEQQVVDIRSGDSGRAIQLNPDGTDDGTLEYWSVP
jgi:hypothetical protein